MPNIFDDYVFNIKDFPGLWEDPLNEITKEDWDKLKEDSKKYQSNQITKTLTSPSISFQEDRESK